MTLATRDMFSEKEIQIAYNSALDEDAGTRYAGAAKRLTDLGRGEVSRQKVRNWVLVSNAQDLMIQDEDTLELMRERRLQQTNNNKYRARERKLLDALNEVREWKEGMRLAALAVNQLPVAYSVRDYHEDDRDTPLTLEILVSDLQIGKLDKYYDSDIAARRVSELARMVRLKIDQYERTGYTVQRLVVCLMGDIIESADKHPDSGLQCDTSTAEQIANAVEVLHKRLIVPLAVLGIEMDIMCCGGNHDRPFGGMSFFKAGRTLLSYPIYHSLMLIAEAQGLQNVHYVIPEETYTVYSVYESMILLEHGVGVKANEQGLKDIKAKRAGQLSLHIDLVRIAHYHTATIFNAGEGIINGSFFGAGDGGYEYSSSLGFNSEPVQVMVAHCPKGDRRSTVFDITLCQLGHIR